MFGNKKRQPVTVAFIQTLKSINKEFSMTVDIIRCIEIVPKRHAFKARFYNNAELKNWVDFGSVRKDFNYLFNLILQAVLTQPEKDSPSFLACWLICSSRSSSKRRFFLVLFERSYLFFSFFSCTGTPLCVKLPLKGTPHYRYGNLKKQSPEVLATLPRDLTTITLNEVMIMANRYDSAHLRARQSKLYKFYDLSTAQVIQTTATTERQARKNLGKQSLIFIARIRITPIIEQAGTWGGYSHE